MSIPLNLGMPAREPDPRSLLSGLLWPSGGVPADPAIGTPLRPASALSSDSVPGGRVRVLLDVAPDVLDVLQRVEIESFHIDCAADELDDVLALNLPARVVVAVGVTTQSPAEIAQRLVGAGMSPLIDADTAPGLLADFLAVLAHTDAGFVGRARDTAGVLRLLAATTAALRGDDVRVAASDPDVEALQRLNADAATALREVLLGVEVPDAPSAARELRALGLT